VRAEKLEVKCEFWHKRLGRLKTNANRIDLDARTRNEQGCAISDAEFKWQKDGGRADLRITLTAATWESSRTAQRTQ